MRGIIFGWSDSRSGDVSLHPLPSGSAEAPHLSLEGSGGLCAALTVKTDPQSRHTASRKRARHAGEATATSACRQLRKGEMPEAARFERDQQENKSESAYKPGSVVDNHSSAARVAADL